ncbi:MAG TPA: hypothetical protein VFS83_10765 [Ktedonobacterales bacterium]|nr:hypothetical protein [Ktedonobacterales bacterium]
MRRVELLLGIGTALAAVAAIIATIFAPIATTGLSVDGAAPVTHDIYARDHGLVSMLVVIVSIAALAACVLLGAYYHARRGSTLGRALMWAAALAYIVLTATSLRQGSFAVYPALLALACALVALIPSRRRVEPGVQATHG